MLIECDYCSGKNVRYLTLYGKMHFQFVCELCSKKLHVHTRLSDSDLVMISLLQYSTQQLYNYLKELI